jgi:hypothetical protein
LTSGDFTSKLHEETIKKMLAVRIASQVSGHGQVPLICSPHFASMHHLPAQGGCDIHCIIQARDERNKNIYFLICSSVTVNPEHTDIYEGILQAAEVTSN